MPFPVPELQSQPVHVLPSIFWNATREDVLWNRPVFKAPPLILRPRLSVPVTSAVGTPHPVSHLQN